MGQPGYAWIIEPEDVGSRLQTMIGECMSLEVELLRLHMFIEAGLVQFARQSLTKAAARLETPLEVKDA